MGDAPGGLGASASQLARGLALACHPGPCLVVTTVFTAIAVSAGRDAAGAVLVACALLTGQLSVGWSNDAYDAARDARAHRSEKPTVRGLVSARLLWCAAAVAAVACIPLSIAAAGVVGGLIHVGAVASAWSYNLVFKTTVLSPLPYAVSFGALPFFITQGLMPRAWPTLWSVFACVALGVAAHIANALRDIGADVDVGGSGLVSRMGARTSGIASVVLLVIATTLVALGSGALGGWAWLVVVAVIVLGVGAVITASSRRLFTATLVIACIDAALLIVAGGSIVR
jgi:1,4-dihydroxy-2-naphthoate octaprenyltransferase